LVAENGRFGGLFSTPLHQRPTPRAWPLYLFRLLPPSVPRLRASTADLLTFSTSFSYYPPPLPHFFRGAYFGSSSSLPKMGFSPIHLQVLARSVYGTVFPTGLHPCLPRRPPLVLPLLSSALSHECTTIANPPCVSSSTLDRP
jgi:hypothetical protein